MTTADLLDDFAASSSGSKTRLYEALGLAQTATAAEVRKAYFRLSLRVHPDRCPDDPDATKRFQSLQKIYAILSDPEKRKLYDETGITDADDPDAFSDERCQSLREFYKKSFNEVTADAIDKFKNEYQGSEEEVGDVLSFYTEFEGDMNEVFNHVMLSEVDVDAERFIQMIEDGLRDGRVQDRFEKYEIWREKLAKRGGGGRKRHGATKTGRKRRGGSKSNDEGGDFDLAQAILAKRGSKPGGGLSDFAAKFGVSVTDDDPLSDDAFLAARERLQKSKR